MHHDSVQPQPSQEPERASSNPRLEDINWFRTLSPYFGAEFRSSLWQLSNTAIPFLALWYLMLRSLEVSYWLTLALAFPAAGLLMRLFIFQHDCGHGSFFKSRWARDLLGSTLGIVTLTPYAYWRKTHALHHARSGNLDLRGFGDVDTLTIREYLNLSKLKRLGYRIYRNPFFLFGLGAYIQFFIKHRFPWDLPRSFRKEWASVWKTNLSLVAIAAIMSMLIGWQRFLMIHVPIMMFTSTIGVFLFYVQHQFEDTYWHDDGDWEYFEAGMHGSSHLVLPKPLQWISGNIGLHHIHHINARIPNYKLQRVFDENPVMRQATQIRIRDTWRCLWFALWDEDQQKLVGFRALKGRSLDRAA